MKHNFTNRLFILLAITLLGSEYAFANNSDYYSKRTAKVTTSGAGKVYVSVNADQNTSTGQGTETAVCSTKKNASSAPSYKYTFKAETNAGYKFEGWYTAATGGTRKSQDATYTETDVSANTNVNSASATYFARMTANTYYIAFDGDSATSGSMSNLKMTYGTAQNLTANAYKRAYTVTYNADGGSCGTSSATATYTFQNWNTNAAGTGTTYTDEQEVNKLTTTNNATVTLYAKWSSASVTLPAATKAGAVFDGWFIGDDRIGFQGESYTPTANVTLIAKFVNKYDSEASWKYSEMKVDDVQSNALELVHFDNPDVSIVNTNIDPINNGNGKVIEYDYANNTLTAHNAGTATIRFTQDETNTINAATVDVTITVTKHANALTVNGSANYSVNAYMGNTVALSITSINTNTTLTPIVVAQTDGADYGTYYANSGSPYLEASYVVGTATWSISQAEDYKFLAASTTMTLNTVKMAESSCYVLQRDGTETIETHVTSTSGETGAVMTLDGPGTKLTCDVRREKIWGVSNASDFYIQYSLDGSSWSAEQRIEVGSMSSTDTWYSKSFTLPENVKAIRFESATGSTGKRLIRNVKVQRSTYLNAEDVTVDRNGDNYIFPGETGSANLTVDWSLVNGGDLKLKTDNEHFRVSQSTISGTDCNDGKTNITVYFDAVADGTETAKLFIGNNVYTKTVNLTGICRLYDQTITWKNGVNVMVLDGEVINPASAITDIAYTSSNENVIRVEGNKLIAVGTGTCNITATAAANTYYYAASDTKAFEVSERKAQWIVWNQSLIGLRIGDANKVLNAYATSEETCTTNGSRAVTYSSDNEAVVKIINGNELQVVGIGTAYVTATQAGGMDEDGHNYVEATMVNKVVVAEPSTGCTPTLAIATTEGTLFSMEFGRPALQFDVALNPETNGQPVSVSFDFKREKSFTFTGGDLILSQCVNGEWEEVRNFGEPNNVGSFITYSDIALNRNATALRFYRPQGGTGYHYVSNIVVKMAQYIEAVTPEQIESTLGETKQLPVNVHYSGVSGMVTFSLTGENAHYSIDKTAIETSCGSRGSELVVVSYRSDEAADNDKDTLTITDGIMTRRIPLVAHTETATRNIIWSLDDEVNLQTLETLNLQAECKTLTDITAGIVKFRLKEESTTGVINNNVLSFESDGDAIVEAYVDADANYDDATPITKTIHVAKTPTSITAAPTAMTLVFGRGLEDILLDGGEAANTFNDVAVEGSFSAVSGDVSTVGSHDVTVRFTPTNADLYATSDAIVSVSVANNIFTVDGEWGTDTNWSAGDTPRADEDVTIAANVTITGDVEVNSLTITEGNTVTLAVTGSLTINNSSMEQPAYGNMVVKEGGEIILNGGETKVNNFTIEASIGDNSHEAKSGEIEGIDHLAISGDAYFVLMLDQSGRCSTGWYHISVPFPVDVMTGIVARWDDTDMTGYEEGLRNEHDYAIMDYHEEIRATGKYGWKKFRGIMMPGKGYSMTINNTAAYYRFKKASGYAVEQLAELQVQRSAGDAADCGWNALGNGMLNIANLIDNDILVQMHDHATKTYQTYLASEVSFAVGSSFFFQASSDAQAVAMELSAMHDYLRAPQARFATADERYTVSLTASGANRYDDRVFVSANEDALYSYQAGRDVAKMGDVTEATISQIWCEVYGQQLCRAELPLINDNATFPLGIFSPKAGEYILSAQNGPANGELWLTYEDVPVWNLSEGDYTLSLGRGTINGYALHLVIDRTQPATPTDAENITAEHDGVKKVLINNVLYIVRDGMIFDATGTKIELQ